MNGTEWKSQIKSLLESMTIDEKISQLVYDSPAVDRLNIPAYNWWNECLHGIARAGAATVFPQAIALAATFDTDLLYEIASAISDEARAKYNEAVRLGNRNQYRGLTFWTPNVNIFRDPRWGRGQETYGEDPYLSGKIGSSFVRGLQGSDSKYLKTAACAKHFAVHSGPELLRHSFNAVCSKKDLFETYLPAFKTLVKSGVESVMGAYNRVLGEPCCGSHYLLREILRGQWGFKGHVVSDCWAIRDFHEYHKVTETPEQSAALALNSGCDLNCGCTYPVLDLAVKTGLVQESTVDESVTRLFRTRFRLGILGDSNDNPYATISKSVIRSPEHIALSRKAAEKSIVLLKNDQNILPLDYSSQRILLIGPAAANVHALIGNYYGLSPHFVTILEGITEKVMPHENINFDYVQGCCMYDYNRNVGWSLGNSSAADVVIAAFGIDGAIEGEEGDSIASVAKGDRKKIELPEWQLQYLRDLRTRKKPVILILTGGSPIAVPPDIADAILFVWYPGEQGGAAIADILFGDVVPSGKLPVTFPKSTHQLPAYEDYSMKGRTYRFMSEAPLFPFGFGLSYTTFRFNSIVLSANSIMQGSAITATVSVTNTGTRNAEEVVQLYVKKNDRSEDDPQISLRSFTRIAISAGSTAKLQFVLDDASFESFTKDGESVVLPGCYTVIAADSAPVLGATECGAAIPVQAVVTITK